MDKPERGWKTHRHQHRHTDYVNTHDRKSEIENAIRNFNSEHYQMCLIEDERPPVVTHKRKTKLVDLNNEI